MPYEDKVIGLFLFCYANHVGDRQEFTVHVANNNRGKLVTANPYNLEVIVTEIQGRSGATFKMHGALQLYGKG